MKQRRIFMFAIRQMCSVLDRPSVHIPVIVRESPWPYFLMHGQDLVSLVLMNKTAGGSLASAESVKFFATRGNGDDESEAGNAVCGTRSAFKRNAAPGS